uniref:Uncharacterized protein n=1 Tax=Spironucleus salmonicida TaxID=348837 RepID=V6LGP8_9EUKA|eukprot:EST42881.1 Hypothetical protein SS50377_17505 [Spironucleus salmonicida]
MQLPCIIYYSILVVIGNGSIQQFLDSSFGTSIVNELLRCTKQTDENLRISYEEGYEQSQIYGQEDFEVVGFKGYSVESRNSVWQVQKTYVAGSGIIEYGHFKIVKSLARVLAGWKWVCILCDCAFHARDGLMHYAQYKNTILLTFMVMFTCYQA